MVLAKRTSSLSYPCFFISAKTAARRIANAMGFPFASFRRRSISSVTCLRVQQGDDCASPEHGGSKLTVIIHNLVSFDVPFKLTVSTRWSDHLTDQSSALLRLAELVRRGNSRSQILGIDRCGEEGHGSTVDAYAAFVTERFQHAWASTHQCNRAEQRNPTEKERSRCSSCERRLPSLTDGRPA